MGAYVLYGGICTVWGYMYCMGVYVLYGCICTVWGHMYCMGAYVLYGIHSMDEREGRQASSACSAMQ